MKTSIVNLNFGEEFLIKLRRAGCAPAPSFLSEPASIIMRSLVEPKSKDYYKYCIFGWKNKSKYSEYGNPWVLREIKGLQNDMIKILGIAKDQIAICENYNEYNYGWWSEHKDYDIEFINLPIIMPDQKCIGCNKPAPHSKPNHNKYFACKTCIELADIYLST